MKKTTILTGAFLMACTPVFANDGNDTATIESIAALATGPCFIHQSGDVAETLKTAKKEMFGTGLPMLMEQGESIVFGDWAGLNVTLSASIDSVSCAMRMPGTMIDHAGFEFLEAQLQAVMEENYPGFIDSSSDDPSPHVDSHDWVVRTEANDALAITLQFETQGGIIFVTAAQQKYD